MSVHNHQQFALADVSRHIASLEPESAGSGEDSEDDDEAEMDFGILRRVLVNLPEYIAATIGYEFLGNIRHALIARMQLHAEEIGEEYLVSEIKFYAKKYGASLPALLTRRVDIIQNAIMDTTHAVDPELDPSAVRAIVVAVCAKLSGIPPVEQVPAVLAAAATGTIDVDPEWPPISTTSSHSEYVSSLLAVNPRKLLPFAVSLNLHSNPQHEPSSEKLSSALLRLGHERALFKLNTSLVTMQDAALRAPENVTVYGRRERRRTVSSPRTQRRAMKKKSHQLLRNRSIRHTSTTRAKSSTNASPS